MNFNKIIAIIFVALTMSVVIFSMNLLAINLGATPFWIGLIGSMLQLTYLLFSLFTFKLFRKLSSTAVMQYAVLLNVIAIVMIPFVSSFKIIPFFALLVGVSAGMFWPTFETLLAVKYKDDELKSNLAVFSVSWSLGATFGFFLSGLIGEVDVRLSFYSAAVLFLFVSYMIFKGKYEKHTIGELFNKENSGSETVDKSGAVDFEHKLLYVSWITNFSSFFNFGLVIWLFPKLAMDLGFIPVQIGLLIGILCLFRTVVFNWLGKSRYFFNARKLLLIQINFVVAFFILAKCSSLLMFAVAFILIGLTTAFTYTASLFYSVDRINVKGSKANVHEAIISAGGLFGPLCGGIVAHYFSLRSSFVLALGTSLFAIFIQMLILKNSKPR